jgi:uncharacterized membrane protein YphA (DoxX/SURF4 family)
MKTLVNISRVIVGVLFIFSGLVKANDPLGLSYKMQEFFDVWAQNSSLTTIMHGLDNYALAFSIIMITLEIVIGVGLLIGWSKKFVSWMLLILIIFFTFLTGYAVLSGKIRTCGCFGDCIPLTAIQSFIKDIVLFILILIILIGNKYIQPIVSGGLSLFVIVFSTVIVLFFQWHVHRHLPFKDCLPFKKGNNLLELRKMPSDAIPDKVEFRFVYQKNGEKKQFTMDKLPDSSWTFVSREDIIVEKGKNNEPPIKDFVINTLSGTDTTEALLNQNVDYYLFFVKDVDKLNEERLKDLSDLLAVAKGQNKKLYVVASQASGVDELLNKTNRFNVPVFSLDVTALKTASRTDPSAYLMHGPVVKYKWGWADIKTIKN